MATHRFSKVLDSQHRAATKATKAALEKETEANTEFLAAMEAQDNAAKALQKARGDHQAKDIHTKGIHELKKLLGSGDLEIIKAILGRPKGPPMGDLGQRCRDAKYASCLSRWHGLWEWNSNARAMQSAYTVLVDEGYLPPLDELLKALDKKEAE